MDMHSSNSRRSSVTSTSSDSSSSSTNSFTHNNNNNPSHLMKSKPTKNEEDDNDATEENIDDLEEELDRLSNDGEEAEEEHDALFEMDDLQSSTKTTSSSTSSTITSIRSSLSSSLLSSLTNTSPTTITTMTTPTLSHLASPSSSTSSTPIANSPTTTTASSSTTSSAATTPTSSATTTPTHFSSAFAYNNNNNNNSHHQQQQQQQQCSAINIPLINTSKTSTGGSLQPPKSPHHHQHHHHSRTTNKSHHHHHVHTKYVTPQQVANMVVLQPPIQDKVLPLLLIDLRSYDEYCSSHIEWSINMQIPDKLVSMSDDELIQLYHSTMNSMMMNSDDLLHASPRRRSNSSANTISPMSSPRRSSNMNINNSMNSMNSMNSSNSSNSMGGGGSSSSSSSSSSIQSTPIMIRPMRARSGSLSISPNTHYLSNATATTTVNGSSTMLGTSHSSYYASAAHPSSLSSSLSSLSSSLPSSPSCSPRMTSADPAAESILKLLEVTCFPEKVFESKFQWRHLSHAVLFVDCDDHDGPETEENKRKKRVCRWLYRLLKREHKIKALSILKSSFQEFQRSVPFLVTNKRHKEYDFPTIINSFMYLGTHRMLTQPGGIDVLMKRKLGVQFVLNCAHECGSVIPESYLEAGKFTYKKIDLESEVEKPLSESLSFEKVVEIIQFIEGARKRHRSLECNNTNSAPTTPVSDSDSSTSSTRELPNRRLSIGSSARESAKLFIHCHEGRCRGVAVCCIYFMVRLSWNLNTCLQFFRVHRPLVSITEQYMKWLQRFDHMMSNIPNRHEIPLSVLFTEIQQRWATEMQEQPITPDESNNNPKSPSNK